ncbi:hypothetical protein N0V83_010939 [Neocucurbitaria cava]|uniref:Uncharacterized protein n=1 Tax=Neocucurbitaria cava TaxID=798079 RepID=A0A9W8XY52_9PLEO|nr:hypothetical protein N0V83_010939 [Neocucurbitaria cava]
MVSSLRRATNATKSAHASAWNTVFVDQKVSKKTGGKNVTAMPVDDINILDWTYEDRQKLVSKGNRVRIFVGEDFVVDMSKPLFRATSTKGHEMLKGGNIKLPSDTDKAGVARLVNHLETVIQFPRPARLVTGMPMSAALSICAAAALLGMDKYVTHVYKKCEALLRMDPPTYEDLDAIVAFSNQHKRLYSIVVNELAVRVWDDTIPDADVFNDYLLKNPILDSAIKDINEKYATKQRIEAEREERRLRYEETRALREEQQKRDNEHAKATMAREKASWAEKKAKAAALEKSCQQKILATTPKDRKFTTEERLHWLRIKGKQPPKGC